MDDLEALGAASHEFVRLVGVVEGSQWAAPTPCEGWDVRELVAHVVGGNRFALLALSGRALDDAFAELFSSPVLGDEPRRDAAETGEEQLRAFERAVPLGTVVEHPAGEITAARFLQFRVFDVVVHSWDLAAALGSAPRLDEDVVVRAFPGAGLDGVGRTPAGSGGGLLDELVRSTGRDLTWAD